MFRCKSKSIAPRGLDPPCAWDPDVFVTLITFVVIIIIITRRRLAFGRLGLGRSSGGKTSGDVSTPHFAPSALSSALKQYTLALLSR